MIEIDGSKKAGSGTILRVAVALSAITCQSLHIYNIRQNRPQTGLKPQHLEAVLTAARFCNAEVHGGNLGSRELWFRPGEIRGGKIAAEIGTAGSIPLLLTTVLPICAYSHDPVDLIVSRGGTDVSHAPTINYLRYVLLPILGRMGLQATIDVHKYGYYPKGNGEVVATIERADQLKAVQLRDFGSIKTIKGVSVCTFLTERKVAERQAEAARLYLSKRGYAAEIQIVNDESNPLQKGSSLLLWAETDTGALIGADAIGEIKKSSEKVGEEAAQKLYEEITAKPTVDIHLADLLIPYIALAEGRSVFLTRAVSEHLETNVWLAEEILKIRFNIERTNKLFKVQKTA